MKKSILNEALGIALSKKDKHSEKRFIHFAFVVQDNKILEWGMNHIGVPPVHFGYQDRIEDEFFLPKTHAEHAAWKKARGLLDKNKPFEIINIRLNQKSELRLSKPCPCCYGVFKELGCRRFYYSSNIGFLSIC